MKEILKIENLKVKVGEREILKGVNFKIKEGETHALLGPNGSGKTSLVQTILGNPKFKIKEGKIFFLGKEINKVLPEKRVKMGLALAWQNPPEIKGVKLSFLLEKISKREIDFEEIENLKEREVNVGFSGGEKKLSELFQVICQKPKLAIFDEIDSGLDIKKREKVAKLIKKELIEKNTAVLLITHSGQILHYLKPHYVWVMVDGKIVCCSFDFKKVLATIKKYGYERCKKCLQKG